MNRPLRVLSALLFLLSGFTLLYFRFVFESRIPAPSILVSTPDLYRYFIREQPATDFPGYAAAAKAAGLIAVFSPPETVGSLVLNRLAEVTGSGKGKSSIRVSSALRVMETDPRIRRIAEREWEVSLPASDLANLEFGYPDLPPVPGVPEILLVKNFQKKSIDGSFDPRRREILYAKDLPTGSKRNCFQPDPGLESLTAILAQYRRAILERKDSWLVIPFFEKLSAGRSADGLGSIIAAVSSLRPQPPPGPPARIPGFCAWVRLVLLFSAFVLLRVPPAAAVPLVLPALFLSRFGWMTDVYLAVFFVLAAREIFLAFSGTTGTAWTALARLGLGLGGAIMLLSGLGTDGLLLSKTRVIHGVTFATLAAFLAVFLEAARAAGRIRSPGTVVSGKGLWILFAGFAAVCLLLFVGRSFSWLPVLPLEVRVRDLADSFLFSRPRFKELAVGYPLLAFALFASRKGLLPDRTAILLIAFSSIGWVSTMNTFLHFQSFLVIGLFRTVLGLGAGVLLGWTLFIVYSYIMKKIPLKTG